MLSLNVHFSIADADAAFPDNPRRREGRPQRFSIHGQSQPEQTRSETQ